MADSESKTFELTPSNVSDAMASRFDATDKEAFEALHEHEASGKLRVTIDGSPYSGEVEHDEHHHHDGDHDDHDHGDEHKH